MSRRRFVYTDGGQPLPEPYEVSDEWQQPDVGPSLKSEEEVYGGLRQADGTVTDSRKKLREWVSRNGLAHHDDFKEHRAKVEAERVKAFTPGGGFDKERRTRAVVEAYEKLRSGGGRRK